MRIGKWFIGGIFAITLILCVLISSFQIALYTDLDFYKTEYLKYEVPFAVNMKIEDILTVTDEMMKYLIGDREELQVMTTIDGSQEYFFNERELAHMEDVKNLFIKGLLLRRISIAIMAISLIVLLVAKVNWKLVLARSITWGIIICSISTSLFAVICVMNFNKVFTQFHVLFFDNDLWLLDPDTDRLINLLPEGFFIDTVIRIGIVFGIFILLILLLAIIYEHGIMNRKNRTSGGTYE